MVKTFLKRGKYIIFRSTAKNFCTARNVCAYAFKITLTVALCSYIEYGRRSIQPYHFIKKHNATNFFKSP